MCLNYEFLCAATDSNLPSSRPATSSKSNNKKDVLAYNLRISAVILHLKLSDRFCTIMPYFFFEGLTGNSEGSKNALANS